MSFPGKKTERIMKIPEAAPTWKPERKPVTGGHNTKPRSSLTFDRGEGCYGGSR